MKYIIICGLVSLGVTVIINKIFSFINSYRTTHIINSFSGVITSSAFKPNRIYDTKDLPYSKNKIKNALLLEARKEREVKKIKYYIALLMALAQWQNDVGQKPIKVEDNEKIANNMRNDIVKTFETVKQLVLLKTEN